MSKKTKEADQLTIEGTTETETLAKLAERVDRAVSLIAQLRRENEELRGKAGVLEEELASAVAEKNAATESAKEAQRRLDSIESEGSSRADELERDLDRMREERDAIRGKVEGILEKLEGLEAVASD